MRHHLVPATGVKSSGVDEEHLLATLSTVFKDIDPGAINLNAQLFGLHVQFPSAEALAAYSKAQIRGTTVELK